MNKCIAVILLALIMLYTFGCGKDVPDMEKGTEINGQSENEDLMIMNVSLDKVEKITLYSEGVEKEIAKDSKLFLDIAQIIESNEELVAIIDGGVILSLHGIGDGDYVKLSTKYECDVYVIDLSEETNIEYAEYKSKDNPAISIFIIPQYGEFGIVVRNNELSNVAYTTLANVEKNIFEAIIE